MMANQKEWLDLYLLSSIITKITIMAGKVSAIVKTAILVAIQIIAIRIILISKKTAKQRKH